jgi:hypothetical protein
MEFLIVLWLLVSFALAFAGKSRRIGFTQALVVSLLLSPLIGLIIILLSEKNSETLMKLKIAYDSGSLTKEQYNRRVRKVKPNKEDTENMLIGYGTVAAIGLLIYLFTLIF